MTDDGKFFLNKNGTVMGQSLLSVIRYPSSVLWVRRNLTLVLIAFATISAIYTYVSLTGSATPLGIKPKRVWTLLFINTGLLVALMGVIAFRIFRLWQAIRSHSAGSKLQKRIVVLFSVVAITPTIIVLIFSALFFNLGIQTWFNERVQTAVDESLAVAEAYLAEHKENIRADALAMAGELNQSLHLALTDPPEFNRIIVTQSTQRSLTESIVFQHNRIIAQGRLSFALAFEQIPQDMMDRAAHGEVVIIPAEDENKVRALIRLDTLENAFLLVGRLVDDKVIAHIQNARGAVSEYNQLQAQLDRLQIVFSVVFILLAFLLLLSSVGYGMVFASRLTTPISNLVVAAERVRGGDFSARVSNVENKDEVGLLARSFNKMTEQLQAQRGELIEANRRLDERRRFSEAVLSGVSAGVIALDRDKNITLTNRSSAVILQAIDQPVAIGTPITEALPGIQELLAQAEQLSGGVADGTLTINQDNNSHSITLHIRITAERLGEQIEGFIVTFDDITQLVSAQRNAAWADVARRIAHEIKNPLTPIQLAAERLKRKYLQYITDDQENFIKYTDTISKQVGDIGRMVDEFVSFARMPTPVFADEDIAGIIKKSVFAAQVANPTITYQISLPDTPIMLNCDERQISQVLINLFKNAAEAIDARMEQKPGEIEKGKISVTLFYNTLPPLAGGDKEGGSLPHHSAKDFVSQNPSLVTSPVNGGGIIIVVEDNGVGFPPGDAKKMLEPYVTTRSKGTGLGLAIVRKIMEDHKGKITLENSPVGGARVLLYLSATV